MSIGAQVPDVGTPIFDSRGYINPVWQDFFFTLLRRTGGAEGVDAGEESGQLQVTKARLIAEEVLRSSFTPPIESREERDTGSVFAHGVQYDPVLHAAVTASDNGFMLAADKQKLDSITGGAAVSSVAGTAPIQSSGGSAPVISIDPATTTTPGSQSATDKTRIDALSAASSPTFKALNLSDGQLAFPATQVPSANPNTLDDYEEGVWTPSLSFVTPGNLAVTYAIRNGFYTKIGRMVFISYQITTSAFTFTTAAGNLIVTGLPFPSGVANQIMGPIDWSGVTKAGYTSLQGVIANAQSAIQVVASGSGVARANVQAADTPTGATIIVAGTISYFV